MRGARIFSKIDLRSGYNHVHIRDEYISKTTFRNRYGNYEYTIVPFGLTDVLATFMCLMNGVFKEFLDIFIIVVLDDIMIYSNIEEEHEEHLRNINIQSLNCLYGCTPYLFISKWAPSLFVQQVLFEIWFSIPSTSINSIK